MHMRTLYIGYQADVVMWYVAWAVKSIRSLPAFPMLGSLISLLFDLSILYHIKPQPWSNVFVFSTILNFLESAKLVTEIANGASRFASSSASRLRARTASWGQQIDRPRPICHNYSHKYLGTYIILMIERYEDGNLSTAMFTPSFSHTPVGDSLHRDRVTAPMSQRPKQVMKF